MIKLGFLCSYHTYHGHFWITEQQWPQGARAEGTHRPERLLECLSGGFVFFSFFFCLLCFYLLHLMITVI